MKLQQYICNQVANKKIVIILNVDILTGSVGNIGTPKSIEKIYADPNFVAPPQPANQMDIKPNVYQAQRPQTAAPLAQQTYGGNQWNANPAQPSWGNGMGGGGGGMGSSSVERQPWRPSGSGAVAMTRPGSGGPFRDIQAINPYQRAWVIKGRCTYKSDLRKYQNQRGEGVVFSFELTDKSGSIRVTAFKEVATAVYEIVKNNSVYTVTRGQLKTANPRYNRSTSDYEMTLDQNSEVKEAVDDGTVQEIKYNFIKIAKLEEIEPKSYVDVIAVAQEIMPTDEIISKSTREPIAKRAVTLVDDSGASVQLTLWRDQGDCLNESQTASHPIVVLRGVRRGDYQGVSLDTGRGTAIDINPRIPEAIALRQWYDSGAGQAGAFSSLGSGSSGGALSNDRKSLEEGKNDDVSQLSSDGKPVSFTMRGMVGFVRKEGTMAYPSDPATKKKVVETAPGVWHSDASDKDFSAEEIKWRYVLSLNLIDHTGTEWMTAFDEAGEVIVGRPAADMEQLKENDNNLFSSILDDISFRPLVMQVVVKEQMYKDDQRIRYTINRVQPVDFVAEGRTLLKEIQAYAT